MVGSHVQIDPTHRFWVLGARGTALQLDGAEAQRLCAIPQAHLACALNSLTDLELERAEVEATWGR